MACPHQATKLPETATNLPFRATMLPLSATIASATISCRLIVAVSGNWKRQQGVAVSGNNVAVLSNNVAVLGNFVAVFGEQQFVAVFGNFVAWCGQAIRLHSQWYGCKSGYLCAGYSKHKFAFFQWQLFTLIWVLEEYDLQSCELFPHRSCF